MSSDNEEKSSVDSDCSKIANSKKIKELQFSASSSALVYGFHDDQDQNVEQNENYDLLDELILHRSYNENEDEHEDENENKNKYIYIKILEKKKKKNE